MRPLYFDQRKISKVSPALIEYIELLTVRSDGFITCKSLSNKIFNLFGVRLSNTQIQFYRHTRLSNILQNVRDSSFQSLYRSFHKRTIE